MELTPDKTRREVVDYFYTILQVLQYRDQLTKLLAELVEFIVAREDKGQLIEEILVELDRIDVKDLSKDTSCQKNISTFLIELAEKCPQELTPAASLDQIFKYLEQDSYVMRNASLSVITLLIMHIAEKKDDDTTLRDELLDALLEHIRDITSYTRCKALSLWCTLCDNQCIPNSYIVPVTNAAVNRLNDKSCLVRKNALRFVISILGRNPYSAKLPLKIFADRHAIEKATLQKLMKEEKERVECEEEINETLSQSSISITEETDPEVLHPCLKIKNLALTEESPVETQRRKVTYLENSIAFTKQIHKAIPLATEMLHSKNVTDIQEAIDFFVYCHEFGIDEAYVGFRQMILLMNCQEKSVRDRVSSAYKRIFFESSRYEGKNNIDSLIVQNFINFVQAATIGECLSLEILLAQFLDNSDFTKDMERELWARFTKTRSQSSEEDCIASIILIGMIASHNPDIINHNLSLCCQYGFANDGCTEQGSRLIRETCIAIRKSIPRKLDDKRRHLRLARDDEMFERLGEILVNSMTNPSSEHWFSMCDEALRVIFDKAENPEKICESIYKRLTEKLLDGSISRGPNSMTKEFTQNTHTTATTMTQPIESPDFVTQPSSMQPNPNLVNEEMVSSLSLSRFIHFLGDVALNTAVYLELHVLLELKIRASSNNKDKNTSANNISAHNISISSRRRSIRYGGGNKSMDDQNLEEEIGLGGAEAEDAEMEFIGRICDEEIVCGKNLLSRLSRVIIEVVKDPFRYPDPVLKRASSLALAKYMMVSAKFCHEHLRLLFTVLERTEDCATKINLLIAISDLCVRFPNQLDGWTGKIFDCLQSDNVSVRRTALKLLSRLVLCDILKAKDQISTMANLIVDDDEQIAAYSKHFFQELNKKLNAIYNVLPDIISRLSDSKTGISEDNFRIVMRFMFELIDKSQHIDRLVEKLCGRFMETDDERHWSDLAYCLSLLKHSDKSMLKLLDRFDCYKDKLCIDKVHESIVATVANYRKTPHLKNDMKQILDEFDAKIAKAIGEAKEETILESDADEQKDDKQEQEPNETVNEDTTIEDESES